MSFSKAATDVDFEACWVGAKAAAEAMREAAMMVFMVDVAWLNYGMVLEARRRS